MPTQPTALHILEPTPSLSDTSVQEWEPSSQDCITALICAEGDLDLAAERLFGFSEGNQSLNKARLISILTEDPSAQRDLQRALRTLSMLQAFSTFKMASVATDASISKMDANQRARFMKLLLDSIGILTDDHTSTTNLNSTSLSLSLSEAVWKSLPPQVQQALKVVSAPIEGAGAGQAYQVQDTETPIPDGPINDAK